LYASEQAYTDALTLFKKTLKIRKKLFKENSLSIAESYNHLGICYYHLFEYQKAYDSLLSSIQIRETILDTKDEVLLISKKNLRDIKRNIPAYKRKTFFENIRSFFF
jgi:tetratricopeptide (TPR) repeat protein